MNSYTKIFVWIGMRHCSGRYQLERVFEGLIPPYRRISGGGPLTDFSLERIDEGDLELGNERQIIPRASLSYRADDLGVKEASLVVKQMENDGWTVKRRP